MARVTYTVIVTPGAYAGSMSTFGWSGLLPATATATSSGFQYVMSGADVILARHNGTASSTHHLILTSVDDPYGRQESLTVGIASGQHKVIGPMKKTGWMQTNGKMYLHANSTKIQIAVLKIAGL